MAVPDKYNLKFIFSNDQFYDPLLFFSGWHRLQRLKTASWSGSARISRPARGAAAQEIPAFQRLMWLAAHAARRYFTR